MSKIKEKTFSFDVASTNGITSYNIYYGPVSSGSLTYTSSKANFPIITDKLSYSHVLPTTLNVGEGDIIIGVTTQDAAGNETDIIPLEYQFDFTPPTILPVNLSVS